MAAELQRFRDPTELGAALAAEILERYEETEGPYLLGCPGGRSLRSTYRALAGWRPASFRIELRPAGEARRLCRPVIEGRSAREQAAVEDAGGEDLHPDLRAERQQLVAG